jgi:hypothetical protein
MKHISPLACAIAMLVTIAVACKKSNDIVDSAPAANVQVETPLRNAFVCDWAPDYGDTILYAQPGNQDGVILPLNQSTAGHGKYCALPAGLKIDSVTGAIAPSKSETGLRYMVGFVKAGTTDTCFNAIVIGGATYVDSMYVVSGPQTLALPNYNANPQAAPVCNDSGEDDNGQGDNKCKYSSSNKFVKLRSVSGAIDLKTTLLSGAFGFIPIDGTSILTTITYSLSDKSNKATQQITVKLVYYRKQSSIPAALVSSITANRNAFMQNQTLRTAPRPPVIVVSGSN